MESTITHPTRIMANPYISAFSLSLSLYSEFANKPPGRSLCQGLWLTRTLSHTHPSQAISGEVRITLWLWETSSVANEWRVPFALGPLDSRQVFDSSISSLTSGYCKSRASCVLSLTATDSAQQELSSNIFYLTPLVNVSIMQ